MPDLPDDTSHERALDPWTLEGLLDDAARFGDDPTPGVAELAALVTAARATGSPTELAREAEVVAAFGEAVRAGITSEVPRTRRSRMLSTFLSSKLAVAAAAGAVTLGGASAAAFTGTLPSTAQDVAHQVIGAPAASGDETAEPTETADPTETATATETATESPTSSATKTPVGPDATGPAAFGLCTAYAAQIAGGHTPSSDSIAFRNLTTVAGGADKVAAYCATVVKPGSTHKPTAHPTGSPTDRPAVTQRPTTHPDATDHPTGAPTTHPTESAH